MATFYHVSRTDISQLEELGYILIDVENWGIHSDGLYTRQEFLAALMATYPGGITNHGLQYLFSPYGEVKANNGEPYVRYMPVIESTFEMIRQLKYPQIRSRFESVFGCQTVEDAQFLRRERFGGLGTIYEVECEEFALFDMNLLQTGMSITSNIFLADRYWSGERSGNPFVEVLMRPPVRIVRAVAEPAQPI